MTGFTRRGFVASGLAAATMPVLAVPARPSNPDVVVIGAGVAGLSATATLGAQNKSVVCIEASNRVGGRAHTDMSIFGVPYDMGAHWLHRGIKSPFLPYGQKNGFDIYRAPDATVHYVGDRRATDAERQAYQAAYRTAISAISGAGAAGKDVAPASVMPDLGPWGDTAHMQIAAYEMGKDFDGFSCVDWYNSEDGADWYCRQGLGALVAHRYAGVKVELETVARTIKWGGQGVEVETNKGTLSAKACIITVSTGVLASDAIQFEPKLPAEKIEAFNGISMGTYNHIALQFRENFFGIGDDGYVVYKLDDHGAKSPSGMGLLVNIAGTNLTFADVGGAFGEDLQKQGRQAAVDFAMGELKSMFGSRAEDGLIKAHVTAWGRNPLTRGSYASAAPGAFPMRKVLRAPLGERLFFAGEATSRDEWATVAGADKEGTRVGNAVARQV